MKNKNSKKGFTLVELLVVIAILAILATVSVVGYLSFTERAKVSNAQSELAQTKELIRGETLIEPVNNIYMSGENVYYVDSIEVPTIAGEELKTIFAELNGLTGTFAITANTTPVEIYGVGENDYLLTITYTLNGVTVGWDGTVQ